MMRRPALAWALAVVLSVPAGTRAAAPGECLSYRANAEVASCANRYAPGSTTPQAHSRAASTQLRSRQVEPGENVELRTVAVLPASAHVEPPPKPERPLFDVDRQTLTNTIIAGAIGGSLLILVALGFWRWGTTLTKACPYCGTKMNRNAHACRGCFRAV